jgi:DNA-directed RNA polymerase subunit M/transcription elongation factor TFIIS
MNEFRKIADGDAPEVGDVVQLLDDSGTPDMIKVPIAEVLRVVDKTSLSGDVGVTPAVSQVWEIRDDEGMSWMVARNPESDEGGKKGFLQVRIAANDSDKQLEMGIKVELEHKDTIEKFRKNPEMTDREVAEMIASDHISEKKDYYTDLKAMESKASLLKESTLDFGDKCPKCGDIMEYADYDNRGGHPACRSCQYEEDDIEKASEIESRLSNPIDDVKTKNHYDLNQSIASLLKESGERIRHILEVGSIEEADRLEKEETARGFRVERDGLRLMVYEPIGQNFNELLDALSKTHASLLKEDSETFLRPGTITPGAHVRINNNAEDFHGVGGTVTHTSLDMTGRLLYHIKPDSNGIPNDLVFYLDELDVDAGIMTSSSLLKESRELSVPEKHQLRIAYDTLKMNDVMARVMGGMTKDEARAVIKRLTGRTVKESAVETKASLSKTETINADVIHIFLADTFPKEMNKNWGTANLKIVKEPDGWSLVNYWTRILYRGAGGKVYFNTKKYSTTTTGIQREIQRVAKELGVKLIPVEDDSLDESIKNDTTPESSPVETTPENPPVEEPQTTEEPGQNVVVTNASLLKKSGLEEHVMEVLTEAGVAHLVEWDEGKLSLIKKEMGSGSEFAEEIIRALGNTGSFGTVTYDAENNRFNFGIQSEPEEVTIVSVLKEAGGMSYWDGHVDAQGIIGWVKKQMRIKIIPQEDKLVSYLNEWEDRFPDVPMTEDAVENVIRQWANGFYGVDWHPSNFSRANERMSVSSLLK